MAAYGSSNICQATLFAANFGEILNIVKHASIQIVPESWGGEYSVNNHHEWRGGYLPIQKCGPALFGTAMMKKSWLFYYFFEDDVWKQLTWLLNATEPWWWRNSCCCKLTNLVWRTCGSGKTVQLYTHHERHSFTAVYSLALAIYDGPQDRAIWPIFGFFDVLGLYEQATNHGGSIERPIRSGECREVVNCCKTNLNES